MCELGRRRVAAVSRLIRATFDEVGISITPDAAAFLAARLGADRKITRPERGEGRRGAARDRAGGVGGAVGRGNCPCRGKRQML